MIVDFQRYEGVNKRLQSVEEVESTTLALDRLIFALACAAATAKCSCAASLGSVLAADLSSRIVRLSRRRVSWPEMMRRKSVKIAENRREAYHYLCTLSAAGGRRSPAFSGSLNRPTRLYCTFLHPISTFLHSLSLLPSPFHLFVARHKKVAGFGIFFGAVLLI